MDVTDFLSPPFAVTSTADSEERRRRLQVLREMSKELSGQVLALLPFQVTLVGVVYASEQEGKAQDGWVIASIILLVISFWLATAALARVVFRAEWTVSNDANYHELQKQAARSLAAKGIAVRFESYCVLCAAVTSALCALTALG